MSMPSSLSVSAFDVLLPKLIAILELTQPSEGDLTPQARQALLQATNEFKEALSKTKSLVNALPGAELLAEDQDEVIDMLGRLRDKKREQLQSFSQYIPVAASSLSVTEAESSELQMEVDSTASTPGA